MCVSEEEVRDNVGAIAVDDLVEEIGGIREGVGAVPAGENVAKDPDALAFIFGVLEFGDQKGEVS